MTTSRIQRPLLPPRRGGAFTLIELLVVISIIALLISILIPSLQAARAQAKLTKCLTNMRGSAQAAIMFAETHSGSIQLVTDEVGVEYADGSRRKFEYDRQGELLSWPVALAQGAGFDYNNNWDWGVRATSYEEAVGKENLIDPQMEMVTCPSDEIRIATPFYPRNKGGTNDGLRGEGDPDDPTPSRNGMGYWGYLSFAINEDITGAETIESNNSPACWRSVDSSSGVQECRGEFNYPPNHPCGGEEYGRRLQGNLDRVYRPGDVGLIFEAGRDSEIQQDGGFANLIITAQTLGPYLGDFQQRHSTRLPSKRHPKGRMNILFSDLHGATVTPIEFNDNNNLPTKYSPRVRVSPYEPRRGRR